MTGDPYGAVSEEVFGQLTLGDYVPTRQRPGDNDLRDRRSIDERYAEWRLTHDGRTVRDEFYRRVRDLLRRNWRAYSHKAIIENIRWDRAVKVGPQDGFKINDHFTSRIARDCVDEHPELEGFFDLRELRSRK